MPPSEATSQYPSPSGVGAMPTIGGVQVQRTGRAPELASPKRRCRHRRQRASSPEPSGVVATPTMGLIEDECSGGAFERRRHRKRRCPRRRQRASTAVVVGRGDADDRVGERSVRRRTEGLSVAEVPHPPELLANQNPLTDGAEHPVGLRRKARRPANVRTPYRPRRDRRSDGVRPQIDFRAQYVARALNPDHRLPPPTMRPPRTCDLLRLAASLGVRAARPGAVEAQSTDRSRNRGAIRLPRHPICCRQSCLGVRRPSLDE